jgi:hypothetical protein
MTDRWHQDIMSADLSMALIQEPSYLDNARLGKSSPWRYLAGSLLIIFIWLGLGSLSTVVLIVFFAYLSGKSLPEMTSLLLDARQLGIVPYFLVLSASFIVLMIGLWLAVVGIHRRPFLSLITWQGRVDWGRAGQGFLTWFLLVGLASLLEYALWPETFSWHFEPRAFIPFAILALILTPIQSSSEELLFRGYLLQAGSLVSRNPFYLSLLSGVLFALPHMLNPEVAAGFWLVLSSYFVLGAFLAWISLQDGTLELALGVHAANNLFAGLVVTFPESVLPTPAVFFTTHFDPLFSLVSLIGVCVLFYLAVLVWFRGGEVSFEGR